MKHSPILVLNTAYLAVFFLLFSPTLVAQTSGMRARVTERVDVEKLVTLPGNVHPLARPEYDQGAAPDDLPLERMLLVLQRGADQEAALRQLLEDQQVKSSERYHQWLTPEQFGQQFGPADADIQAVTGWLMGQGFQVNRVAAGRTVIEFSGTAGQVRQALHTEIHKFAAHGEEHWANASDPQIPAALTPVVAGLASLNNFPRQRGKLAINAYSRSRATGEVHALFTVTASDGTNYYAVAPLDFAIIYNVLPLWNAATPIDGTGQTIAVVSDSNINISDVEDFRNTFGMPPNDPQIILDGPNPGINGDEGEAVLDVEWSGAMAKNATIDLVVSESTETTWGIDLSALYVIDNNLAPIMSVSYGECEQFLGAGGNAFYYATREQGAAQGITIVNSTGDAGSARCDQSYTEVAAQYGLAVSGLASTPFNVAVGGTDFGDVNNWSQYWSSTNGTGYGSALSYIPETTWNSSCAASGQASSCASAGTDTPTGIDHLAGGGGPSRCAFWNGTGSSAACASGYPKPAWQTGTGVPQDDARDIPDISLFASTGANRSFYAFCEADLIPGYVSCVPSETWYFVGGGGTSFAAPNFAGIMALVNQRTGQRQGNANYILYPLAAQAGATCTSNAAALGDSNCIFYDVVNGNNSVACVAGTNDCSNQSSSGYGILMSPPPFISAPAWTTTAGYDLATGLGSVNVANLVNNWKSTYAATTTTLNSLSPTNFTLGQTVNFTVSVAQASGSGTPTGDISLIAQTGNYNSSTGTGGIGIGPFTMNNGSVSASTNMLPGGTYNVVAHYAGDGINGASDSSPQQVTVGKQSSTTNVQLVSCDYSSGACTSGVTSAVYGSSMELLRVDVTNAGGEHCASPTTGQFAYPCPTGTVTATVNGQPPIDYNSPSGSIPGTYLLNSQGYAEDQYIVLAGGTQNIVATYAGDSSYNGSTSATATITITKALTTTTLSGLPSTVVGGVSSYTCCMLTVNTQSHGTAPSLMLQYLVNGSTVQSIGGDVNWGNGSATSYAWLQLAGTPPNLPLGQSTVVAQYLGDSNYAASASAPVKVTVTDFSLSANPSSLSVSAGQAATTTLVVSPLAGFSGTVSLSCYLSAMPGGTCAISPSSVTVSGSSSPTAVLTITTTANSSVQPITLPRKDPPGLWLYAARPWLLALLLALGTVLGLANARQRLAAWVLAIAPLLLVTWVACGGGGGGGGGGGAPIATLSTTSLAFGKQLVNSSSATQTVVVSNTGNADLSISSSIIGGTNPQDFQEWVGCGFNAGLAPGVTCPITVAFTPTAAGSRSASIVITDNAAGSPQTVGLTGTGALPPTPAGTYTIQASATSGGDTHSQTITLNVQ